MTLKKMRAQGPSIVLVIRKTSGYRIRDFEQKKVIYCNLFHFTITMDVRSYTANRSY